MWDALLDRERQPLEDDQVEGCVHRMLAAAGLTDGGIPLFDFTPGGTGGSRAAYNRRTGVIHLIPEFRNPFIVDHEVAHWFVRQVTARWVRAVPPRGPLWCGASRHARNAIVHGDAVVDAVDAETVPTPRVTMASGAGTGSHSRVITPPSRIQWTFTRTLPPPGNPAPVLEAAYAAIANKEVLVPIHSAINWLDRELAAT